VNVYQLSKKHKRILVKTLSFVRNKAVHGTVWGDVYELSPDEAQELNHKGYVFQWVNKEPHHKGEPKLRQYGLIGLDHKIKLPEDVELHLWDVDHWIDRYK